MKVYQAINAVQRDLAATGIGKDSENKYDGYKFRGIDAVYNALSPLLAKHSLCVLPRMLSREVVERITQKGGALFYVTVEAEFDFVSAEDGSKHTVRTFGEAMDRGDKATNKAMSAAYKYAAFQAFAIPTEGDNDADASSHEIKAENDKYGGKPRSGVWNEYTNERRPELEALAITISEYMDMDDVQGASEAISGKALDTDLKAALWDLLPSKTRTALKKYAKESKDQAIPEAS
jgi:hypothetical protein